MNITGRDVLAGAAGGIVVTGVSVREWVVDAAVVLACFGTLVIFLLTMMVLVDLVEHGWRTVMNELYEE